MSIVRLNVGGRVFATSHSTLTYFPDTMLSKLVSGDIPSHRDETGAFFIDRDPDLFCHVLNYLRNPLSPEVIPENKQMLRRLQLEADFYSISELRQAIQHKSDLRSSAVAVIAFGLESFRRRPKKFTTVSCTDPGLLEKLKSHFIEQLSVENLVSPVTGPVTRLSFKVDTQLSLSRSYVKGPVQERSGHQYMVLPSGTAEIAESNCHPVRLLQIVVEFCVGQNMKTFGHTCARFGTTSTEGFSTTSLYTFLASPQ